MTIQYNKVSEVILNGQSSMFTDEVVQSYFEPSNEPLSWIDITQISWIVFGIGLFGSVVFLAVC